MALASCGYLRPMVDGRDLLVLKQLVQVAAAQNGLRWPASTTAGRASPGLRLLGAHCPEVDGRVPSTQRKASQASTTAAAGLRWPAFVTRLKDHPRQPGRADGR